MTYFAYQKWNISTIWRTELVFSWKWCRKLLSEARRRTVVKFANNRPLRVGMFAMLDHHHHAYFSELFRVRNSKA